ncbi:MAG: ComEC/Rec2 family competence protein [Aeromicrobium sp.]
MLRQDSTFAVGLSIGCIAAAAGCVGRWRPLAVVLVCVGAVAGGSAWRLAARESSPVGTWATERATVTLDAVVAADPRRFRRFGSESSMVRLDVRRATVDGRTVSGSAPVVAFLRDNGGDLSVGQRVRVHGRLQPPDQPDVVAILSVDHRSQGRASPWWWAAADRVREGVRSGVRRASPDARALVPALVDGDDKDVSETVATEFRRAGLTHLLAVSGTNLTIVLMLVLAVAKAAGVGRRRILAVGFLAVIAFVLLARPDPSVLRAAAMGSVGLVAMSVGGRGGIRALSTAVVVLLFLDPRLARSAGFALSVCATGGILLAANPLAARLGRWMPRWCALAIAVPLAAQCACLPVLVALSGQVSMVAVAANIAAAPLVAPATIGGLFGGLLDLINSGLALVPGMVAAWCAVGIVRIAHVASGLAGASVPWHGPWWVLVVVVPAVMAAVWRLADQPAVILGLVVGVGLAMVRPPQVGWPPVGWVMVNCDVGQGDAEVVNVGPGSAFLIDTGPEPLLVDGCLRRLHVRRLPLVLITHSHADHVAGLAGAVRGRAVGRVLHGPSGGPGARTALGDRFRVGSVQADVIWPPWDAPKPNASDGTEMNNSSVVMRVRSRGVWLLLTGDVETEAQEALMASGEALTADVLKFPHHGSGRQLPAFIQAAGARVATISVGKDNDYGHPAPSALRLLHASGIRWWRTDHDGDIAIVARDGRISVVSRH